jgi:uncharacterized protein YndB with AHSA1/START domain
MSFQPDVNTICWRMHFVSPPEKVFLLLATDDGRTSFWAESAVERDGMIHFTFPGGQTWAGQILENDAPRRFSVIYYGGSTTTFVLEADGNGGTDLTLTDEGVDEVDRTEVTDGWVSVLMTMKAAADFAVDLRNHDLARTWDQGYADN